MRAGGHRRLPVCVDGRPIGMLTFDDLLDSLSAWLADLSAIQSPRLREASSRRETSKLLQEMHHGVERAREIGWKTSETIFHDLDALGARLKRVIESIL
jgi:signal-transduction protein with cAMP-binding, CBS, and nucleotidyltransferase domain